MKRLRKIQTLALASLSAIALSAPLASAQTAGTTQGDQQTPRADERRGGKHHGHSWGGEFRGLNLTDDQKTRIEQIHQTYRQRNEPLHQALRAKRQELRQASEGGTFNETLATQKLTEAAVLEAKLMGEQFRLRQEILSVLTPEQKTELEQRRAQFEAKRAQRRGRQVQ